MWTTYDGDLVRRALTRLADDAAAAESSGGAAPADDAETTPDTPVGTTVGRIA
jgi:hypothetical protein